jgi:hypothetical protein
VIDGVARKDGRVERVSELSRASPARAAQAPGPPENYLEVQLESGETGLLDMTVHRDTVWADVLRSLQERNQPAYVEIDPATGQVTELLLPIRFSVGRIEPEGEGLLVELIVSHGPHRLRRSNPDFDELRGTLEAAKERRRRVLVTETDEHEIVDVRMLDEPAETTE